MAKAVRFHETGGPEVLRYEDVEVGDPGAGQVRLVHVACGNVLERAAAGREVKPGRVLGHCDG